MKKAMLCLCAGLLAVSLSACKDPDDTQNPSGSGSAPSSESGSSSAENSSSQNPGQDGSQTGEHDYSQGWTEEMTALKKAVTDELGDTYLPDMMMTPDILEMAVGITSDMYDDYLAESPMISANVDTLLIIKAKDDKVDEVEQALNAYRDAKISDTMQYPMNIPKIQASRVEKIGNYVCFVQLGADVMDKMDESEEAAITYCQGENDRVIGILKQQLE